MINPYIKVTAKIDTDVIDKDVRKLKEILERLAAGINQEIIVIIGDDVLRIPTENKSSN